MPKRSNDFQKLIHHIQTQISSDFVVEESRFLPDSITCQDREVDIVIDAITAGYGLIISIEVIGWTKKKGDIEWVERMACKHVALPTNKLILISKSGFTKNAIKKATFLGIETITIEQALSNDWHEFVASLGRFEEISNKFRCRAVYKNKKKGAINPILPLNQIIFSDANLAEGIELGAIMNIILQNEEIKDAIFNHIQKNSVQKYTVDFQSPGNLYIIEDKNNVREINILRIELESYQKTCNFKLQSGSFKGHEIAFGKSIDQKKDTLLTLVKHSSGNKILISGIIEDEQGKRQLIGQKK